MKDSNEVYITGSGQKIRVHSSDKCDGTYCPIHNPSMSWPTHWRDDIGFMEYTCPCGVGYPSPEDSRGKLRAFGCCGSAECLKAYSEATIRVREEL